METEQMQFWKGDFGKSYTDRNTLSHEAWNQGYLDRYGITKLAMNEKLIGHLPKDIKMGFEYYAEETQGINYRGNDGYMWKADYTRLFCNHLPNLRVVKKEVIPYLSDNERGNEDCLYLLEKS